MAVYNTSTIVKEVLDVVTSCPSLSYTALSAPVPTDQETNLTAAYINLDTVLPVLDKYRPDQTGYRRSLLFSITINSDCTDNLYALYDTVDAVEKTILDDNVLWGVIIDRNIASIDYDNSKYINKRTAMLLLEVTFRIDC